MNSSSAVTEPVSEALTSPPAQGSAAPRAVRFVEAALLLIAAVFFALHFVHLRADFPNHSIWMDWSKYTDEGWYGDAAIRHYQLGHWYVPGDFNPAAALPIWPLIEMAVFRFTGVSLVAARALTVVVFGLCLVCCYLLLRRWAVVASPGLGPVTAVVLLAVSPFCFVFMRLAILEPLLILLMLASLLTATRAGEVEWSGESWREILRQRRNLRPAAWAVALGLLLPAMVLTKTTAVFLFPAILWMLWAATGSRVRPFLRAAAVAGVTGIAAWGAYYGLFVRRVCLIDYRYLFSANAYTGITRTKFWSVLWDTLLDGAWMGRTLFGLALAAVAGWLAVLCVRRSRTNPLAVALLLWVLGYGTFLAYHDNLQPRYYLVLAVPLTMLAAMALDGAMAGARTAAGVVGPLLRAGAAVGVAAAVCAAAAGAYWTVYFAGHPEYTFLSAANQVRDAVDRGAAVPGGHSRLVLSISGADLSLMTGLPTICDDFGSMTLSDRVATYKPGWFATWNDVEDDKMEALAPMYRLVRVGAYPAFDDPERNLLILYRLDLIGRPAAGGRGRRRSLSVPRRLRSAIGEQPSPTQLKH